MEITFLGTSAGIPSKERNVSSLALNLTQEKEGFWLFDCGEATQHQILSTTVRPPRISKIFLTHLHADHVLGIFGLLATISAQGRTDEMEIVAPKGIEQLVKTVMSITKTYLTYPIKFTIIDEGSKLEYKDFYVEVKKLKHDIDSFAYKVIQKDLEGVLDGEKARKLGAVNQQLGMLKKGLDVTLEDGTVIKSKDVLGEARKGKVVTIFGDTEYHKSFVDFAEGSDVIIYEGTLAPEDKQKNPKIKHSTFLDACELANAVKAEKLFINHVSSRYVGKDLKLMKEQAKALFATAKVVSDLDTFTI